MSNNREELQFPKLVIRYFKFLERDFNFIVSRTTNTLVRYQSELLFINIYHGRNSYEIGFELGVIGSLNTAVYDLPVILKTLVPAYKGLLYFQASNYADLKDCIKTISRIVIEYCKEALYGKELVLAEINNTYNTINKEATKLYSIKPIQDKALQAWQRKDYFEVVRLYTSIENEINQLERQRLIFARKNLQK